MPNWCDNSLTIKGKPDEVKKVLDFMEGDKTRFDFNKILPMPPVLHDMTSPAPKEQKKAQATLAKKYGYGNWYEWAHANWGTKWNTSDDINIYDPHDGSATIGFQTAWSPPFPVIKALGKKFPDVKFSMKYEDEGMAFSGTLKVHGEDVEGDD